MKILFLSSGNSNYGVSPVIKAQGNSLQKIGVSVEYYTILGKGILGYLSNIIALRRHLRYNKYNCIHAHYALTGLVATFSGAKPLVVSLMGSDVYEFRWLRMITRVFSRLFWDLTIVKSHAMCMKFGNKNAIVLPNGVDFEQFRELTVEEISLKIPLPEKPRIIFIGNPEKREKNYELACKAISLVPHNNFEFKPIFGVSNQDIPYYMNSAKVLLMTSLWEGSPNVIKEAMACGICIVSVDVGDIKEVIGNTRGCFVTSNAPEEIADKLIKSLKFNGKTEGRIAIKHLDSVIIAEKILKFYKKFSIS